LPDGAAAGSKVRWPVSGPLKGTEAGKLKIVGESRKVSGGLTEYLRVTLELRESDGDGW